MGPASDALRKGWLSGFGARLGSGVTGFGRRAFAPLKAATYGLALGGGAFAGWKASRQRQGMPSIAGYRARRDPLSAPTKPY